MPILSIIPAAAVADAHLTDTQVRVLCAIGTFTNRLGGNVWASVATLAKSSHLSPRTVQRALPVLLERGYLRRMERAGRTNLYEVVLDGGMTGVTGESQGGDTEVTPPPSQQSPKRSKERSTQTIAEQVKTLGVEVHLSTIWNTYPPRPEPYPWVAVRQAVVEILTAESVSPDRLVTAVRNYAHHCQKTGVESKYVKGMVGFFRDGYWKGFDTPTVHGRTRDEWARSGQDVSEFDRLLELTHAA